MERAEQIFWGVAAVAAVYIVLGTTFNLGTRVSAQQQTSVQQVAATQPAAQGMGCMAKGGGCGCGGMMKKQ